MFWMCGSQSIEINWKLQQMWCCCTVLLLWGCVSARDEWSIRSEFMLCSDGVLSSWWIRSSGVLMLLFCVLQTLWVRLKHRSRHRRPTGVHTSVMKALLFFYCFIHCPVQNVLSGRAWSECLSNAWLFIWGSIFWLGFSHGSVFISWFNDGCATWDTQIHKFRRFRAVIGSVVTAFGYVL